LNPFALPLQVKKGKNDSKNFTMTAFQVAIGRVQQCALEKAKQRVPAPEEQLALLRNKQGKKQRVILNFSYASLIDFNIFYQLD